MRLIGFLQLLLHSEPTPRELLAGLGKGGHMMGDFYEFNRSREDDFERREERRFITS